MMELRLPAGQHVIDFIILTQNRPTFRENGIAHVLLSIWPTFNIFLIKIFSILMRNCYVT